jgi:hypothetical protein
MQRNRDNPDPIRAWSLPSFLVPCELCKHKIEIQRPEPEPDPRSTSRMLYVVYLVCREIVSEDKTDNADRSSVEGLKRGRVEPRHSQSRRGR